ncbi:MAG: HAMP domain-containing histidine kinase [Oscillospiraceae bacterium]|nr:HAMP domain-containing histidine kinase [Oscillospiraceae bacterium]
MAKRIMNTIATALLLCVLAATYVSGSMLVLVGAGYINAVKNNPDSVGDYTQTATFRRVTGEYMDALYAAVSGEKELDLPYNDEIAFFAYGLDTNMVYCSDKTIYDMPSFDSKYMESDSYIYYLKYSSGNFRGNDKASGVTESFEYSYTDAANNVFGNEQKYYSDAAMIIAVLPPDYGLSGYTYSRIEFALLKNGPQLLFVMAGVFLVCLSVLMSVNVRRRVIERFIAKVYSWIFFEFKLAVLIFVVWKDIGFFVSGQRNAFWVVTVLTLVPIFYVAYCGIRYRQGKFFKVSLFGFAYNLARELFDAVAPVSEPQIRFRRRAAALLAFGIVLPVLFFILTNILFGAEGVRITVGIYIALFIAVFVFVFLRYGKLLNDVCNLTSLTSVFALGGKLPRTKFEKTNDVYLLAKNVSEFDKAVDAAAEMKFRKSSKRFLEMSDALDEIRMQMDILSELTENAQGEMAEEVQARIKHIYGLMEDMQSSLLEEKPISAPVLKRIDLLDVMDDVLNTKIAQFSAAMLKIKVDIPDPPAYITADYSQIRSAFDILFTNTAMYAASGTNVEISLKKDGQNWIYTIVNDEDLVPSSPASGVAISTGLTVASEYVSINGGTLTKSSEGGRFTVALSFPAAR